MAQTEYCPYCSRWLAARTIDKHIKKCILKVRADLRRHSKLNIKEMKK